MYETGTFNLLHVLSYTFLWTTFYFLLCLYDSKKSYEWHCRTVTVVHAAMISALAFYGVFFLGPWPWTDAGGPNTPHQVRTSTICLGYFLFDFAWCLYHKTEGPVMLTHHTLSILGLTWCLVSGKYGTELLATIGGAEITNPLLQLRWFMKEMGKYNTIWGDVIDMLFMLTFGFFRIYLGSILLYRYFQQPTDFLGRLGGTLMYLVGWAFFINILQYAVYKYTKQSQDHKQCSVKNSSLNDNASVSDEGRSKGAVETQNRKVIDVIREKEIPTQREIKLRNGELAVGNNCIVKES